MKFYLLPWFDAHVHLRGPNLPWCKEAFELIVGSVAKQCRYAVVMPNSPIIKTVDAMEIYREQILTATRIVEPESDFKPLMTLYLTEKSSEDDVKRAAELPYFAGWKLYPQGVTTGSQEGTTDFRRLEKVLRVIDETGSRLLIHGETTRSDVDTLHTEEVFVYEDLPVIREMFGGKICLEHCSTRAAIDAVTNDELMWGSITPHHLTGTTEETEDPHNRCKPVWQTEKQRQYVLNVALDGRSTKFFAGSDSAPQLESWKLGKQVPNGCFSAPAALPLYLHAFSEIFTVDCWKYDGFVRRLNDFLFNNAANFYDISTNKQNVFLNVIIVTDKRSYVPSADDFQYWDEYGDKLIDRIVPLRAGELLKFSAQVY